MDKRLGRAWLAAALVLMLALSGFTAAAADGPVSIDPPTAPELIEPASTEPEAAESELIALTGIEQTASDIDFGSGYYDFVQLDRTRRGTSEAFTLEYSDFDGKPAVKVASQGAKMPYIGIAVSRLLSPEDLPKVATVVFTLGIKSVDGVFWPMTGLIYEYSGDDPAALVETSSKFGIQTSGNNPKDVYAKLANPLSANASNYLMIQPSQDDGSAYAGKNDLYILGIKFLDADGNTLTVKPNAVADFPEGYDVLPEPTDTEEYDLAYAPIEASWNNYNSSGVPLDVWNRAVALVIEYSPRDDGSSPIDTNDGAGKFVVQVVGGPAEQGWREIENTDPLVERELGKSLTLTLEDMDQVTEVQNLGYGAWDGADTIIRIVLLLKK